MFLFACGSVGTESIDIEGAFQHLGALAFRVTKDALSQKRRKISKKKMLRERENKEERDGEMERNIRVLTSGGEEATVLSAREVVDVELSALVTVLATSIEPQGADGGNEGFFFTMSIDRSASYDHLFGQRGLERKGVVVQLSPALDLHSSGPLMECLVCSLTSKFFQDRW